MAKIKEELRKKRKRMFYTALSVTAGCVAVIAIGSLFFYQRFLNRQESAYENLRRTEIAETQTEFETETEVETETETIITCERIYDFDELHETNADIYAWIKIPNTKVDYPVLQSKEDNYYLNRNLDHSTGYPGCIYTNQCNAKSFDDLHTVLYGHNMKNDSMFGSLHDYENADFFQENRMIYVYTEEKRLTYEIYGAVKFTNAYLTEAYGTNSVAGNGQFLQDLQTNAESYASVSHIAEIEVQPENKLITLSTCISGESSKRYLIVGVLIEEAYYE